MTIAAGFLYSGGVLLCADSQFTVGPSKIDGLTLKRGQTHFRERRRQADFW